LYQSFKFLCCSIFLYGIKISFLKSGLSNITKPKDFFSSKVQTKTLSALFKTFVITASFLPLKVFIKASTSSQSKAVHKFFG
jgi:hypothetical protein